MSCRARFTSTNPSGDTIPKSSWYELLAPERSVAVNSRLSWPRSEAPGVKENSPLSGSNLSPLGRPSVALLRDLRLKLSLSPWIASMSRNTLLRLSEKGEFTRRLRSSLAGFSRSGAWLTLATVNPKLATAVAPKLSTARRLMR